MIDKETKDTMWKKVYRLSPKMRGELVKYAEANGLKLVRDGSYKFMKNGKPHIEFVRRCPDCGTVAILNDEEASCECMEVNP